MQWKNTARGYGWAAIILHWVAAAGVIWLYFLGENIEHVKEARLPREEIAAAIYFHISIGMTFAIFLAARVIGHIAQRQPAPPAQKKYLNWLAKTVMWLFLLMIGVQTITGPLLVLTAPAPIRFFDLFVIPTPFAERPEAFHETLDILHAYAPKLFLPLLGLHVAGALKHLVIDRNDSLQRILWVRKSA